MNSDLWIPICMLGVLAALIFISGYFEEQGKQRFMQECMADGKKQYECLSMYRGNYASVSFSVSTGK